VVMDSMSESDDMKLKARVFHVLGSWLSEDAIPQQFLLASKIPQALFGVMVRHSLSTLAHF
jgi:hypothetical protein